MLLLDCAVGLLHDATTVSLVKYSLLLFVNVYRGRLRGGGLSARSQMKNSLKTRLIIRHLEQIWARELGPGGLLTTCTAGMHSIF